jgi:hypothetical protein
MIINKLHRSKKLVGFFSDHGPILAITLYLAIRLLGIIELWFMSPFRHRNFFTIFARWDAQWYQSIASHGYGYQVVLGKRILSNEAFFPLFPVAEKLVHLITTLDYINSGILVSWLCGLWATVMIYLVVEKLAQKEIAILTVLLWSIYPISYVDALAYSETLFTGLVATGLYCAQKSWLKLSAFCALLAGLTRPTGLALAAAIALPVIHELITKPISRRSFNRYFALVISVVGWLAYVLYLAVKNHDLFSYVKIQRNFGNGLDGGKHFSLWLMDFLLSKNWYIGLVILCGCVGLIYLLVQLFKVTHIAQSSLNSQILIFTTAIVILAFVTSGYFGSKPRYLLPAFPLLIPIALMIQRLKRGSQITIFVVLTLCGLTYGAFAATGNGPP